MDKVQKANNSEYYTPESETFRIYLMSEVSLMYCLTTDENGYSFLNNEIVRVPCVIMCVRALIAGITNSADRLIG
jgi:hypothetical protein